MAFGAFSQVFCFLAEFRLIATASRDRHGFQKMARMQQAHQPGSSQTGFTLAELLIALAIMAVIATFAIPKVLQAQQDTRRLAIFKETIATIASVLQSGVQNGDITATSAAQHQFVRDYFFKRINAIKLCSSNSATEGCWDVAQQGTAETAYPGFILPNGATVVGINPNNSGSGDDGWDIDYNGIDGPNQAGVDQIRLVLCLSNASPCAMAGTGPKQPGAVGHSSDKAAYKTLYEEIFR